ncbi:hypothetical protein SNE26_02860 [Mucilaginibacter sp. cycad4]|uniref:hypothetical protein n=1 Tax=Mucilaginibacter sp. cycad4 TaxID=3342096 RepID=UPI002AAAED6E|nr:hypothetical protein [Mucilaginibacter gossypii]WPV00706.1 hypothetical protein SNE26_02860 [Mucilaginibacter gossypii]
MFKVPIFQQFLKHPDDVNVLAFLMAFDGPARSRDKVFAEDMQTSVAASLIAHEMIRSGKIQSLKPGSGPAPDVLELSKDVKSGAQVANYNPSSAIEYVFDPKPIPLLSEP